MQDCVVSCLTCEPQIVLRWIYSDLYTLASESDMDIATAQGDVDTLMGATKGRQTISEFITAQVRSPHPACREYAYRNLSLIAVRCFDTLGEKILGLFLKKRLAEPELRVLITSLLWNIAYVWADRVQSKLLIPELERRMSGVPDTHWDLLSDLWIGCGSSRSTEAISQREAAARAVSFLSAARFVAAVRLHNVVPSMVRVTKRRRESVSRTAHTTIYIILDSFCVINTYRCVM
jgi:hypothetical protein